MFDKLHYIYKATLIALSISAFLLNVAIVYTGIFYSDIKIGLEVYLSETLFKTPFIVVYLSLILTAIVLNISVVFLWLGKKTGAYLFLGFSIAIILVLLFTRPIDWLNILIVMLINLILLLANKPDVKFSFLMRLIHPARKA
ncbi:MAG: hypothetical protein V1779_13330 [bacterium]|jgi:hypothetical protein